MSSSTCASNAFPTLCFEHDAIIQWRRSGAAVNYNSTTIIIYRLSNTESCSAAPGPLRWGEVHRTAMSMAPEIQQIGSDRTARACSF